MINERKALPQFISIRKENDDFHVIVGRVFSPNGSFTQSCLCRSSCSSDKIIEMVDVTALFA